MDPKTVGAYPGKYRITYLVHRMYYRVCIPFHEVSFMFATWKHIWFWLRLEILQSSTYLVLLIMCLYDTCTKSITGTSNSYASASSLPLVLCTWYNKILSVNVKIIWIFILYEKQMFLAFPGSQLHLVLDIDHRGCRWLCGNTHVSGT